MIYWLFFRNTFLSSVHDINWGKIYMLPHYVNQCALDWCISPNVILITWHPGSRSPVHSINTILPLLKALTLNQKIAAVSSRKYSPEQNFTLSFSFLSDFLFLITFSIYLDFRAGGGRPAITLTFYSWFLD